MQTATVDNSEEGRIGNQEKIRQAELNEDASGQEEMKMEKEKAKEKEEEEEEEEEEEVAQ